MLSEPENLGEHYYFEYIFGEVLILDGTYGQTENIMSPDDNRIKTSYKVKWMHAQKQQTALKTRQLNKFTFDSLFNFFWSKRCLSFDL